jgi:hypothetical protein
LVPTAAETAGWRGGFADRFVAQIVVDTLD